MTEQSATNNTGKSPYYTYSATSMVDVEKCEMPYYKVKFRVDV